MPSLTGPLRVHGEAAAHLSPVLITPLHPGWAANPPSRSTPPDAAATSKDATMSTMAAAPRIPIFSLLMLASSPLISGCRRYQNGSDPDCPECSLTPHTMASLRRYRRIPASRSRLTGGRRGRKGGAGRGRGKPPKVALEIPGPKNSVLTKTILDPVFSA